MLAHLHILHLYRRVDRLPNLLTQLSEQEIYFYSIHEAIDATELKMPTKKAITLGHKRIIQSAKNNNMPYCIVAEDDIVFTAKSAWDYFIGSMPEIFDLYFGLIYQGTVENNRVLNGMSGVMTLYVVHKRFYDFFLSIPDDCHIDRELGQTAFKHEYYVVPEMCVLQSGSYSDNLRKPMNYDVYVEGKKLFGRKL